MPANRSQLRVALDAAIGRLIPHDEELRARRRLSEAVEAESEAELDPVETDIGGLDGSDPLSGPREVGPAVAQPEAE